jgi:hypothetical protein
VPNEAHIVYIIFPPSWITHLKVIQYGVIERKGENTNPYHDDGVQYAVYKCEDT